MADIESEGRKVDASTLEYVHRSKTGAMITASVVIGGTIGGASNDQIDRLGIWSADRLHSKSRTIFWM